MKLPEALKDRSARIGILGLGYVGLPLAMEFCREGFRVLGVDVSPARVASLRKGRSYVLDVTEDHLAAALEDRRFEPTTRFEGLSGCEVILICVQTPLRKTKEPDLSNVIAAAGECAKRLRKGQLIVLESTTFPGATDDVVRPILESGGKRLGRDFLLAFSPERVDPGNKDYGIANTPKIVGGCDAESGRLAKLLYEQIVEKVVAVSSAKAAEMAKLLENTFRSVNIALANETAQICHQLGLDVWEVIDAAATKPFGFMPFYPGPGIGGHCIPKDPQLLTWKMKTLNFEPRFIQLASTINGTMPRYAVERIAALLNEDQKALKGSRILVLGVAYKAGTSDYRESPALDVIELLRQAGARVDYHDAFVPQARLGAATLRSKPLTDAALKAADCVAILTGHRGVDYARVARLAKRVFDARNVTRGLSGKGISRL